MLIITGTGRSGTSTMAGLFGGYHEFRVNYILDKYFAGSDPHTNPFSSLQKRVKVILDLHQGIDTETFVDSSNLYIHFIDAILFLNPDAKFLFCVRNGKDFARSAMSRGWHTHNSFGSVPELGDPYYERWNEMTPLQKSAWIWVYRNKKALDGLKAVPDRQKQIVRIEDIGRREVVRSLEDFSGIKLRAGDPSVMKLNANPGFGIPPSSQWSAEMHREFNDIAGDLMVFFNYGV